MDASPFSSILFDASLFWAKTSDQTTGEKKLSPVYVHLIDTGLVVGAFLDQLPVSLRKKLAALFPWLPVAEALKLIAFIASGHDIGKISPAFQAKIESARRILEANGFVFPRFLKPNQTHDEVTHVSFAQYLTDRLDFDYESAETIAGITACHHSRLMDPDSDNLVDEAWEEAQNETLEIVAEALDLNLDSFHKPESVDCALDCHDAGALLLLAGMISTADWIASNEDAFAFQSEAPHDFGAYVPERRARAIEVVARFHLAPPRHDPVALDDAYFQRLFGLRGDAKINQLQSVVSDIAAESPCPGLIIEETPMGSGKTEAALLAYLARLPYDARGLYYGLPTQTTGNMMFERVNTFLASAFGDQAVETHLLHADAFLSDAYKNLKVAWTAPKDHESGLVATDWFCGPKRGLIAAHGVGTIDQAMLAAIKCKHFFVRLFGLAGKVVVLDEVHAYDLYMREIILELIKWLAALDCEVVLLSATLGRKWRDELIAAYDSSYKHIDILYPSVTSVRPGLAPRVVLIAQEPFHKEIEVILRRVKQDDISKSIAESALEAVAEGGCAACICNTVKRVQEVYRLIQELDPGLDLRIFHAKYTRADRRECEKRVVEAFGPKGQRPRRSIVVASQVIEQSLDLDFDVLLTELAPIDLLLQRFGRLQRHRRERPFHPTARAIVFAPPELSRDCFGASAYVYEPIALCRSLSALEAHGARIVVPDDVQALVEAVYGDRAVSDDDSAEKLMQSWEKDAEGKGQADKFFARNATIPSPGLVAETWSAIEGMQRLGDDTMLVGTRLARPSLTVALLNEKQTGPIASEDVRSILDRCIKIDNPAWFSKLKEIAIPEAWKEKGPLRYVVPLHLEDGIYRDGDDALRYDCEMGLEILKGGRLDED
jgi:CRISPR-associated endonuclease/helicase Cas3